MLARETIERIVTSDGKQRGHEYRVRWTLAPVGRTELATVLRPFRARLLSGGEIDVAEGPQPIVLVFWASWCKPCIEEAPHLVRLFARFGTRARFVSVSIDAGSAHEDLRRVVAEARITYPVALDPDGATVLPTYARGIGIPLTFVIDRAGKVRYSHHNYQAGDERALEHALRGVVEP